MKKKILLVEDEIPVLEVFEEFFSLLGLETVTARDGEEALRMRDQEAPFDLYLIDIKIPKIDGFSLAKRFREKDPHTPILFLSGLVDQEVQNQVQQISQAYFLKKPATFAEIKEILAKLGLIDA